VEEILNVRFNEAKQESEWLVSWVGFGESENTWEPAENVKDLEAFVDFQASNEDYHVAKVLDKRYNEAESRYEWLIWWTGYSKEESSWEPAENLEGNEIVEKFESNT